MTVALQRELQATAVARSERMNKGQMVDTRSAVRVCDVAWELSIVEKPLHTSPGVVGEQSSDCSTQPFGFLVVLSAKKCTRFPKVVRYTSVVLLLFDGMLAN